jgi:hypothetical protein
MQGIQHFMTYVIYRRFLLYFVWSTINEAYYLGTSYGTAAADMKMYLVRK